MKVTISIFTFCCSLFAVSSLLASNVAGEATTEPENIHSSKETRVLDRLLQMDDRELARLRQTIERIEKMSAEEKAELRKRIGAIHRMPPERVAALRKKFKAIPREQRKAIRDRWMEMSPEERTELRLELRKMAPKERQAFLKEKGILPPPPKKHKKDRPLEDNGDSIQDESM